MNRRRFLAALLGAPVAVKSYFFFGGIYRPKTELHGLIVGGKTYFWSRVVPSQIPDPGIMMVEGKVGNNRPEGKGWSQSDIPFNSGDQVFWTFNERKVPITSIKAKIVSLRGEPKYALADPRFEVDFKGVTL